MEVGTNMNSVFLYLYAKIRELSLREEGQDLVEYALVVALVALGASAGMAQLASAIGTVFSNISSQLTSSM